MKAFETEGLEHLNLTNKLVFFGATNHGKENFTITEQVGLCMFLHNVWQYYRYVMCAKVFTLHLQIIRHSNRTLVAEVESIQRKKRKWCPKNSRNSPSNEEDVVIIDV